MEESFKIRGIVAAPFTPMDNKGNVNYEIIEPYCSYLAGNGLAGVFINGSTGEGPSLTAKEKERQTIEWIKQARAEDNLKVINMIGSTSYRECIESAIFSHEAGVDAVSIVAPYYFKPPDAGYLAEFVAIVGEAVPGLPIYFYHIPSLTGVNMPMLPFLKQISAMLPNFAGIKYTQEDFFDFHQCLDFENGKFNMLWGRDECLLSAYSIGCRGFIGSTYNYAAPLYHQIIRAFEQGDMKTAASLQLRSVEIVSLLGKYGGMGTGKAFMKYIGCECGEYRSPVRNLTGEQYALFVKDINAMGLAPYLSLLK